MTGHSPRRPWSALACWQGLLGIGQARRKHGLDLVHVPYRSAGDSINDRLDRDALITPVCDQAGGTRFAADEIALWAFLIREIGVEVH